MDIDTRVLRYFIAVAEQLSFTRAARELFLTQPSLSRQIQRLESDLGLRLIVRSGREIRLTEAGEALLPLARGVVSEWEAALREVRGAEAARQRLLRIGFVATGAGALGRRARALLLAGRPGVRVEPKRFEWGGEAEALRRGLVDVAFVWLPADLEGLDHEVVAEENRWVAVAASHRLGGSQDPVGITELRDEPLLWTGRAPRAWVDWWAVNPRPDGSAPVWGPQNDNVEEMLEHTATGTSVCFGTESMAAYYAHPDLVWRPLAGVDPLRIALAWPHGTDTDLVRAFRSAVREAGRTTTEGTGEAAGPG
ncbi:LysR family transcriptional regulator [Streptomyces sp. NPDC004610]|uniref:LysR family transcriptional regulator n=1 Tax=unclassified Streptomyces TaxID=2593676 RepID=UPI0033AEA025